MYVKTRKKKNGHQINETRMCQANTREHKPASEEKDVRAKKSVLLFLDVDHLRREIFS